MPDLADIYNEHKKSRKQARAQNRENSVKLLEAANVPFTVHNAGAHLIVEGPESYIDFWPGTGRWKSRPPYDHYGFGIRKLLDYINQPVA